MTGAFIFCYHMDMSEKDLIEVENKIDLPKGEDFSAQSNIDDFLKEEKATKQNVETDNNVDTFDEEHKNQSEIEESKSNENLAVDETGKEVSLEKKKIDEAEQSVSKKNTKKSKIINIVFFIVNLFVVGGILTYQLLNEDFVPITGLRMDVGSLVVVIFLMFSIVVLETFLISYLVKQSTGKWRFGTSYKVAEIGRYYDAVTPMATGGQPFQVTYLKSRGVPLHNSLSIPLAKYVFGQIAWVLISFVCLVVSWVNKSYGTFVSIASIVGFCLAFFVLAMTVFLSVCKTVGKKLVVKILKLLYKMKIVKNYDKQYEKITKYISDYQDVMKQYARSPKDFIIMTLVSLVKDFLTYALPFFIVKFLVPGTPWSEFFSLFVMTCLVNLASSFFPLPGGTGMTEISFAAAFGTLGIQSDVLVWVLILWRFCTYYFYLLQGICVISYDMAYGNRKYQWQVRKNRLAEESAVFKQEQINRFRADRAKRRKSRN